jgi:hypothetical protein
MRSDHHVARDFVIGLGKCPQWVESRHWPNISNGFESELQSALKVHLLRGQSDPVLRTRNLNAVVCRPQDSRRMIQRLKYLLEMGR